MLSVVIQAGGQSSRMGEDKALRRFLGRPLIERVVQRLRPAADEMLVTTNRPEEYAFLGLPLFPDVMPGRGSLGGLLTALASAREPLTAVAACDLPFASAALLRYAAEVLLAEDWDAVLPESEGGLEPMHAVYRRDACLPAIEAAVRADQWRAVAWLSAVRVRVLRGEELRRMDPDGLAFLNVNTPEEFARAEALALAHDQHRAGGV